MEPQNSAENDSTLELQEVRLAGWATMMAIVTIPMGLYLWAVFAFSDYLLA